MRSHTQPGRILTPISPVSPTPLPSANLDPKAAARASRAPRGPWLLVGAAVVWNLVNLRALTLGVPYVNDSSVHAQMVRFATEQFQSGHLPLTSWFPYLGLGSPQFLHYQSVAAMLTGLIGLATGPDVAFRWSLYLLLALWPVSVYFSARLFGAHRWAAGAAAAMAPFLMSAVGIGYEQKAYVWSGFGVWTQLWASLTLPLAWGLSWRAIREGRGFLAAVALVSLTTVLHFETGYLALLPLLLWPFVSGGPIVIRLRRAAVVIAGSLLVSAWMIVPLLEQRAWAATNEILRGTADANGYGAEKVLKWLVSGQLLDYRRLPVVTVFAAIGLVLACSRVRRDANARGLLVVFAASLLLSFGRATFGGLVDLIPGSADIFFRRFMMGGQLAALLLAGGGAAWCAATLVRGVDRWRGGLGLSWPGSMPRGELAGTAAGFAAAVLVLTPAWMQLSAFDRRDSRLIHAQRTADASQGIQLDRLISVIKRDGGGRVYAGTPLNWGAKFAVGTVPVLKYLEDRDVDEVGYLLRTASLMTDPEAYFDESDPGDYSLFGIRYLILPSGRIPAVPAHLVTDSGIYTLWRTRTVGYVDVGRIVGGLSADRTNVGLRSIALLRSRLTQQGDYLRVTFGHPGAEKGLPPARREPAVGRVISEHDDLDRGEIAATVSVRKPGVVVLSSSFDPGWTATMDGRARSTQMVAPALVATALPVGVHAVTFRYRGLQGYPQLLALCGLTLVVLLVVDLARRRSSVRD